ncbi:autotransporter outer membrane beta-barrel domain-containing protein [Enterobacter pasteurii]|uniref:autotransporter outer membrane beta-barrel domain-containing protein n=1 Tax=Enterobacter pasteurii TaxID=3029761 RepID=UPI0011DDCB82|nr:autotransporter outer membrane beta-barrel domain-containing protein [Enterobacter pasteurii]QLA69331.1 autotransporter outer membrane beta-barrel domain-containing protein [Enterobacter pasteurii]
MTESFQLKKVAASMSLILGGSLMLAPSFANTCTTFSAAGTCGLTEYQMTSKLDPVPTAWYFTQPTQDAAINGQAKKQNIYFASGSSSRQASDVQQLRVDGADLSGYYINASKNGTAAITLANKAKVDWLEAEGATTHTKIIIDDSTLNGASAQVDYDKTARTPNYSKNYAKGYAIYLSAGDNGNTDIDIQNGSVINGKILAGGAGTHDITLRDSRIQSGSILLSSTKNDNTISVINSSIDTTGAVTATDNAINITNGSTPDKTHAVTIDNGRITGSVNIASTGSTNALSVKDSTISKTIQADGNAVTMKNGATTLLTLDNSEVSGHALLSGTGSITASLAQARLHGNLTASKAAQVALEITASTLDGILDASAGSDAALNVTDSTLGNSDQADSTALSLKGEKTTVLTLNNSGVNGHTQLEGSESVSATLDNAQISGNLVASGAARTTLDITRSTVKGNIEAGQGSVDLHLTNSTLGGDVNLASDGQTASDVWLDNSRVAGHLYGGGAASTLHLAAMPIFEGAQFSRFGTLEVTGDTVLNGGFTNNNVGSTLTVKGNTVTAPVRLSSGKLTFSHTRLVADTLALSSGASLNLTNHSQLQTRADQLFNAAASSTEPVKYNDTGARTHLTDSTLILTDAAYQLDYVKGVNGLLGQSQGNALVMLGTLQNPENASGTASVIDAAITGAVLANTQVTSAKNQLYIGAESAPSDQAIAVPTGFGASQLRFEGEGKPSVTIGNAQTLTLTGAAGALIEVAGAPQTPVAVAVNNGTLNLGVTAMQDVTAHLTGTVTIAAQGTMNVVAGDHTLTSGGAAAGIVSSGLLNVAHQATLHADVALQDQGQLAVTGALLAGQLTAAEASQIAVGDSTAAGSLMAERLDLQGARLFIDPAWTPGGTLADASRVASGGSEVNGRVTVGQNALLVLGDTSTAVAEARFADSGLRWGENAITAAVSIQAPQYLNAAQGGLRVDGALTGSSADRDAAFNRVDFADRSLLMLSTREMTNGQAALNATGGSLSVADSAALYVADAKANQTYAVARGFSDVSIAGNGWQNENLLLNKLLTATTQERDGEVLVTTRARAAQDVLPGVVTAHALDRLIASGENSRTATQAGARYLSVAIDTPQASVENVVRTVNSAAQIATAGGVQHNTWAAGSAAVDAVMERNSIANAAPQPAGTDASVWVHALYGNPRSSDLRAGNLSYGQDSSFYGLMMGGDKAWQTDRGTLRSGAAFHAGNGDSDSRGDVSATHNDFSFWGITLYQNWNQDRWNLTGDVSLTQTSSNVDQKQPGWMEAGSKLKANVDGMLFSAGVRAEYLIETNVLDIIPHAGVRYNQLTTDAFDTKNSQDERVFHTDKGTQTIWQFPVGVKVAKAFSLDSGWTLSPQADATVVAVSGDRESQNTLHTVGISASDTIRAEIMDDTAFNGQLGIKMQKRNMTFGVGYNVNASQHDTSQTVSATWSLAF